MRGDRFLEDGHSAGDDRVVIFSSPGFSREDVPRLLALEGAMLVVELVSIGQANVFREGILEGIPKLSPLLLIPIERGQL